MNSRVAWLSFSVFLIPLFLFSQQQNPATGSNVTVLNSISWGLKFSLYNPKVDDVSSAFEGVEDTVGLARGPRFKISYLAGANVRYSLDAHNVISIEGGLSLSRGKLQDAESIERIYSLGLQYYYRLQDRAKDFIGLDAGAGAGLLVANFERNYGDQRIAVLKKSVSANGSLLGWFSITRHVFLEVEGRYTFVPKINVDYPNTTIKMSSVMVGAGISIEL